MSAFDGGSCDGHAVVVAGSMRSTGLGPILVPKLFPSTPDDHPMKGMRMSNSPNAPASPPYRLSAAGLACSRASAGTGAPKTARGSGLSRAPRLLAGMVVLCATAAVFMGAVSPAGAEPLPDGRVYEMVTPVENQNAEPYVQGSNLVGNSEHGVPTRLRFQAAAGGGAVAYPGGPSSGGNGNAGQGSGNEYLAARPAGGGWTQVDLQPPGLQTAVYEAFSSELSVGILDAGLGEAAPLLAEAPGGGYNVLYTSENAAQHYRALFTTTPPHRSPGEFMTYDGLGESQGELSYAGSSADLGHLLFEANDALTAGAVDGGAEENNLYDSVGGQLQLVNVLPDGSTEANAIFGAPRLTDAEGEEAADVPDFSHVVSADGSRIFWTDLNTGDLYVRENDTQPQSPLGGKGECTVPSDACTVLISEGGRFWTASADGSSVLFTEGGDLYEYDVNGGTTTDLAPSGEVEGVAGASENGEYVYFVAKSVLASGAAAGLPNLYLYHGGATTFIATLAPAYRHREYIGSSSYVEETGGDNRLAPFSGPGSGDFGDWQAGLGNRVDAVSADGHSLVFTSIASLTGYDNTYSFERYPGEIFISHATEVYVYEADTGKLTCVSCDPNGAPLPVTTDAQAAELHGVGGYLPVSFSNTYQPRVISEEGDRVFFNSTQPLVAQDTNGHEDAYEWERDGTGSCQQSGGCVYLLSGGTSTDYSYFLDASASGDDVFIETRAQLVPRDQNESFDVYDVRVGGARAPSPPVCLGTGCQGVPGSPPVFATPSSVTFNGVGNFPAPGTTVVKPKAKTKKSKRKHRKKVGKGRGKASGSAKRVSRRDRGGK
jgi:hypothetical protein